VVKLVDFGVAKAEGRLHQTRAGLVKGKFAYMAPEQISGGMVDGRSDLFALSEVFYELLLHRHPFYATTDMDVLRAILEAEPPAPAALRPGFPQALSSIFLRGLRKRPSERWPDAATMQEALEHFLHDQRSPATTIVLGRFIRELFQDRMRLEQEARESGDDQLLLRALNGGAPDIQARPSQSARGSVPPKPRASDPAPHEERTEPPRSLMQVEPRTSLERDGSTGRRRIRSEVRHLFEKAESSPSDRALGDGLRVPTEPTHPADELPSVGGAPLGDEDPTEMPTRRLSPNEVAEVRSHRSSIDPGVVSEPGPGTSRGGAAKMRDPADSPSVPMPPAGPPSISSRSATVQLTEPEPPPNAMLDRFGILFFIFGLGALVAAVIFAIVRLTEIREPSVSLAITSTPPGAAIVLDGREIGAVTPRTVPALTSDRPHQVELRLSGYPPCLKRIEATRARAQIPVDCVFSKEGAAVVEPSPDPAPAAQGN
jgi:serine/threonine protein kinase